MDTGAADRPPKSKHLCGSLKKKLKRQAQQATVAAEKMGAPAIVTPTLTASIEGRKRRKDPENTPPGGAAKPTKNEKRANPLTMVVAESGYPDSVLTAEQFELFREVTWRALEKESPNQWPKFETAY